MPCFGHFGNTQFYVYAAFPSKTREAGVSRPVGVCLGQAPWERGDYAK